MNLQREPLARVEKFDEQGKMGGLTAIGSQKLRSMGVNLLTQRLALVGTVRDDGLDVVTVTDFPGLADAFAKRDRLAVAGERITAPNAFDQSGGKFIRIEHFCALQLTSF